MGWCCKRRCRLRRGLGMDEIWVSWYVWYRMAWVVRIGIGRKVVGWEVG